MPESRYGNIVYRKINIRIRYTKKVLGKDDIEANKNKSSTRTAQRGLKKQKKKTLTYN